MMTIAMLKSSDIIFICGEVVVVPLDHAGGVMGHLPARTHRNIYFHPSYSLGSSLCVYKPLTSRKLIFETLLKIDRGDTGL